jgi:hypothetical protein
MINVVQPVQIINNNLTNINSKEGYISKDDKPKDGFNDLLETEITKLNNK